MGTLYTWIVQLIGVCLHLTAFFSSKLRAWLDGRKTFPLPKPDLQQPVWIHCASLGEFEQARPVIDAIKAQLGWPVLLSFFSPSGYMVRNDYPKVDQVIYLPLDTPANARRLIDAFQPRLAIMVKYDLWFNHLQACLDHNIPLLLISAQFSSRHWLFKPWAGWFRNILFSFEEIFVQDQASLDLLKYYGYPHGMLAGDTRIDRVLHLPTESRQLPALEEFTGKHPVLVAGSTWPKDEALLVQALPELIREGWKTILVPHDVSDSHLATLFPLLEPFHPMRLSAFEHGHPADLLVVDQIGLLGYLYRYATIVYIGGGFGAGIHNTLEPMAFGKPVLFGPKYHRFPEAVFLVKSGAGSVVTDLTSLQSGLRTYSSEGVRMEAQSKIEQYLQMHQGATGQIIDYLRDAWKSKTLNS